MLKQNKYFGKRIHNIICCMLLVAVITAAIFAIYFQNSFSVMYTEQLLQPHKTITENIIGFEYNLWKQGDFILNNTDIALVINEFQTDIETKYKAIKTVNDMKILLGITEINILDDERDVFWNGDTLTEHNIDGNEENYFGKYYEAYKAGKNFFVDKESNQLIYFYDDYRGYAVIFVMNYDDFGKSINFASHENRCVYYKNEKPLLVSGNGNEQLPEKIFEESLKNENGSFVENGELYVYTYDRGILCVTNLQYGKIIGKALLNSPFIWIFAFILFGGILFVKKYVKDILEKSAVLKEETKQSKMEMSIIKLFTNQETNLYEDEAIGELFKSTGDGYFVALMFMINLNSEKSAAYKVLIKNIDETFSKNGCCKCVRISQDVIGMLYKTSDIASIRTNAEKICAMAINDFNMPITSVKSKATEEIGEMLGEIKELVKLAKYRFITGDGSFIDSEEVCVKNKEVEYPLNIQMAILSSLREGKLQNVEELLGNFIDYIDKNDYTVAESWTLMLFLNIMRNISDYEEKVNFKVVENITKQCTFKNATEILMDYLKENLNCDDKLETEFVEKIKSLTELNYANPEYDLNYIAGVLGITSVHASRKFKKLSGQNFSQYLSEFRLNKAKKLLEETELKISDISVMCGFGSITYFGSVFKKYLFVTPVEYRAKFRDK